MDGDGGLVSITDDARALHEDLVRLRHALHAEPEVGLWLPRTQEKVLAELEGLPLEVSTGTALTSVTGVLRGARPGPVVLLRGDMDGLPVDEKSGVDYASRIDGAMHACGHDLHTTMLVGAARLLAARRDELRGDVVFMFQPGEEGWDGAGAMIEEGILDVAGRRPDAAYALHVTSAVLPHGIFSARPGPTMSASDALTVTVKGAGGHGSTPYLAKDPVPAACEMVTALQTLVTRQFDPFDPVVLSVGSFHAGTRRNVIPDTARFEATVRSFSRASRTRLETTVVQLIRSIAAAHGLRADVEYAEEYPLTVTDPAETSFAQAAVTELFGEHRFELMRSPQTASEDFSRVLDEVPGSFVLLGACPPGSDPADVPYNHSPRATYDDAVLSDGAALYAELATRRLAAAAA
jgi:amidohydrolase